MNTDYLLTSDGQRVHLSNGVRLLCTARHPVTMEVVILKEVVARHTFQAHEPLSLCASAGNDDPTLQLLDPVEVETSIVVVSTGRFV